MQIQETETNSKPYKIFSPSGKYLYPTVTLINFGLNIFTLFVLLVLAIAFARIAYKPVPNLVQLRDGTAIQAQIMSSLERDPQILKTFVAKVASGLLTWNNIITVETETGQTNEQSDTGVVLPGREANAKVPTSVWQTSFALSQDFRQSFLNKLAQTIPEGIYTNRLQTLVEFKHIGEPMSVGEGQWEVPVIANIVFYEDGATQQDLISFNKIFVVQAIDTPPPLLGAKASYLELVSFEIRSYQLEVIEIKDYRLENNYE